MLGDRNIPEHQFETEVSVRALQNQQRSYQSLVGLSVGDSLGNLLTFQELEQLSEGKPVSILPHNAEMTSRQAASILNVSPPQVSKLLKEGKMDI